MENLQACRVCLATNVKVYSIHSYNLQSIYENLTGIFITIPDKYPPYLCVYCQRLLVKSNNFKETCIRTHDALQSMAANVMLAQKQLANFFLSVSPVKSISIAATNTCSNMKGLAKRIKRNNTLTKSKLEDGNKTASYAVKSCSNELDNVKEIETLEPVDAETVEAMDFEADVPEQETDLDKKDVEEISLSKAQQLEEFRARKDSDNFRNSHYKCDLCYMGFMSDFSFKNHMVTHDPSSGPHVCEICSTRFQTERSLKSHCKAVHEMKYLCKMCDYISRTCQQAKKHIKWHEGHSYVCKTCGESCSSSKTLLSHVRSEHPLEYCCECCGDSFVSQKGLALHKKKAHNLNEKSQTKFQFLCLVCKTKFKNVEAFTYHNDITADGTCDPSLSHCTQCGDCFENQELLNEHLKIHKEEPVQCDQSISDPAHQNSAEKPFHCTECPKKFSVHRKLEIHMRSHTGEKPFKCSLCPKAFNLRAALHRHDRVHTGIKPYVCIQCGKSFTQSNSMKLHVNTVHLKMPTPYKSKTRRLKIKERAVQQATIPLQAEDSTTGENIKVRNQT